MTVITPDRSLEQRRTALEEANRIRSYRARLKKDIKAGRTGMLAVLMDPPEEVLTMKVYDLLRAQPAFGRVKVQMFLKWTGISPSKTVGGITDRQRGELASAIHGWMSGR